MRQIKIQIKLLLTGLLAVVSSMGGVVNAAENTSAIDNLTADDIYSKSYFVGKAGDTELRKIKAGEDFYYLLKLGTPIYKWKDHSLSDGNFDEMAYILLDQNHVMDYLMFLKGLKKYFPIQRNEGELGWDDYIDAGASIHHLGKILVFEIDALGNPGKAIGKNILTMIITTKTCSDDFKFINLEFLFGEPKIVGIPPNTLEFDPSDEDLLTMNVKFNKEDELMAVTGLIQNALLSTGTNANPDTFERLGSFSTGGTYPEQMEVLAYATKKSKRFYIEGEKEDVENKTYNSYLWIDKAILPEFINWLHELYTNAKTLQYKQDLEYRKTIRFEPSTQAGGVILGTFDTEMTIASGSSLADSHLSGNAGITEKDNEVYVAMRCGDWWSFIYGPENLKTLIDILKSNSE